MQNQIYVASVQRDTLHELIYESSKKFISRCLRFPDSFHFSAPYQMMENVEQNFRLISCNNNRL